MEIALKQQSKEVYEHAIKMGLPDIAAQIMATKLKDIDRVEEILYPTMFNIPDLDNLTDSETAAKLIYKHIKAKNRIIVNSDYDFDGVSSGAVIYRALKEWFGVDDKNLFVIINNREHGNGFNQYTLDLIKNEHKNNPLGLIITGDHGSADDVRYKELKDLGIEMCITDHHLIPDTGNPINPEVFVNPQKDNNEPFNHVSGCAVTWIVMKQVYKEFIKNKDDSLLIRDNLIKLLPIVGCSTLADSMPMDKDINRALVHRGMQELNAFKDPIWIAMRMNMVTFGIIDDSDVSYSIAPIINAAGRMGDSKEAFNFLTATNYHSANKILGRLISLNGKRKKQQKEFLNSAIESIKYNIKDPGLVPVINGGHGVGGIVASMVGERFIKPTMVMSVTGLETLTGSGRAIVGGFNVKKCFDYIKETNPGVIISGGGHEGAGGCKIYKNKISDFTKLWNLQVKEQLGASADEPKMYVTAKVKDEDMDFDLYNKVMQAGPYGKSWEFPYLEYTMKLVNIKELGWRSKNLMLTFKLKNEQYMEGIFINGKSALKSNNKISINEIVNVVFTPTISLWNDSIELKLMVKHVYKN